jgi:hypothetical protein
MDTSFLRDEKNWIIFLALIIGVVLMFFQVGYKKYSLVEVKQFATSTPDWSVLRMPKMEPAFPYDEITIPPAENTMDEALRAALNLGNENPFYTSKTSMQKGEATTKNPAAKSTIPSEP